MVACRRSNGPVAMSASSRGRMRFSSRRISQPATPSSRPMKPRGSTLARSLAETPGGRPSAMRSATPPMARPKGVEMKGRGTGVMKGNASNTMSTRWARRPSTSTISPRVTTRSPTAARRRPSSAEMRGSTWSFAEGAGEPPTGSGAAFVAIQLDVQAVGVAVAASLADFPEPGGAGAHPVERGGLGHEQDLVRRDRAVEFGEQGLDFVEVGGGGDDELELIRVGVDPGADDVGWPAGGLVAFAPGGRQAVVGERVAQLGRERGEVAGDAAGRDGGGGLDGDVVAGGAQGGGKRGQLFGEHGFASGEHGVATGLGGGGGDELGDGLFGALGIPGGVGRVAPVAAEIAAGGADEERRHAGELALALDGIKGLGDEHGGV